MPVCCVCIYSVLTLLQLIPADGSCLFNQMMSSYKQAIAPGTALNRERQAHEYLSFAVMYKVPFLAPSVTQACMYLQLLANKHAAPTTIKNYISGARTWIQEHAGYVDSFLSPQFTQLLKGLVKKSTHVPRQAPALSPDHIKIICRFLDNTPSASLSIKPAILLGYSCFLRSGNLVSPSTFSWGGPHTLMASDVKVEPNHLLVYISSTKTRPKSKGFVFKIEPSQDPQFCPRAAWISYKNVIRPWALGPAFIHANGLPLIGSQVVAMMRLALQHETDIEPERVSMHSLRRGATQTSVDIGIPYETIKSRGTWTSDAGIKPYLPSSFKVQTVPVPNLAD